MPQQAGQQSTLRRAVGWQSLEAAVVTADGHPCTASQDRDTDAPSDHASIGTASARKRKEGRCGGKKDGSCFFWGKLRP